jgi:hypothetical protein
MNIKSNLRSDLTMIHGIMRAHPDGEIKQLCESLCKRRQLWEEEIDPEKKLRAAKHVNASLSALRSRGIAI